MQWTCWLILGKPGIIMSVNISFLSCRRWRRCTKKSHWANWGSPGRSSKTRKLTSHVDWHRQLWDAFQLQGPVGKNMSCVSKPINAKMVVSDHWNLHGTMLKMGKQIIAANRTFSTSVSNGWDFYCWSWDSLSDGSLHNDHLRKCL